MLISTYIIVGIIVVISNYTKEKRIFNTVSIISLVWLFVGMLSTVGIYGMIIPRTKIHIFNILFVIIFNLVNNVRVKKYDKHSSIKLEKKDSGHIYFLIFSISIILLLPMIYQAILVFIETFDLNKVRSISYYDFNSDNYYLGFIFKIIPFVILEALIIAINYNVISRRINQRYIWISIIALVIKILLSSTRYIFVTFIVSLIIATILNNSKVNYKFIITIIFMFCLMAFITQNRGGTIIKSGIVYYSGSFSYFEYILRNPQTFNLNQNLYGQGMFGFIIEPFLIILKFLGFSTAKVPSYHFNTTIQNFYNIGSHTPISFNNNTTMLFYFYRDYNYIGILIGSFVYSFIFRIFRNNHHKGRKMFSYLYIFFSIVLINGVMSITDFVGPKPIVMFITFYLMTKNITIKK